MAVTTPLPGELDWGPKLNDALNYLDTSGVKHGDLNYNVRDYGAIGNGTNDDTSAIQDTLNAATSAGARRVFLPAGTYLLTAPVTASGSIELAGEGQERTVITPPAGASAFTLGSLTQSQPHGLYLHDMTFRTTTAQNTDQPIIDLLQYGRKWTVERLNFDCAFSNRTAIRLYTSWIGSIRDCNFWKLGAEGVSGQRAAIVVKPVSLSTGNGPINNVVIDACAFERVQIGIDLHDPADGTGTTSIYAVEIRNARFKNSSTSGPVANSIGIRSNSNSTFAVVVSSPFFEDFDIGAQVRGHGWSFINPFVQSATTCIDLVTGSAHLIDGMIIQGSTNNTVGTSVLCEAGVTGVCEVRRWKNVGTVATPAPTASANLTVTAA